MTEIFVFLVTLVLFRPFLGVLASVLLDFWASSYDLGPLPMRNYLVPILTLLMAGGILLRGGVLTVDRNVRKLMLVAGLFIILGGTLRAISGDGGLVFIGRVTVPIFVMGYCAYFTNTIRRLRLFIYFIAIALTVSSAAGILQFFGIQSAWDLHAALNPDILETELSSGINLRAHIAGLANYSIPLAYSLCAFIPLFLSLIHVKNIGSKLDKYFFSVVVLISGIAMMLSMSRSGILGMGVGTIMVMFNKVSLRRKIGVSLVFALFVAIVFIIPAVQDRLTQNTESTRGTAARTILGLHMALDNPLGTGGGMSRSFIDSFEENYIKVYDMEGAQARNISAPHNQFIDTSIYYGFLGLALLILFNFYAFRIMADLKNGQDGDFVNSVAIGAEGSLMAYIIHSMFHNAGPFMGELYIWYLLATVISLSRINLTHAQSQRNTTGI